MTFTNFLLPLSRHIVAEVIRYRFHLVCIALKCIRVLGFNSLKAHTLSSAKMSSLSTHILSESGYPFHLTKY